MENKNLPVVIQTNAVAGFSGGAEIELLGYAITGVVEKDNNGTRVLVMTKDGKKQSQTVNDIINRLNAATTFNANIQASSVDTVLGYVGLSAATTTINLNQAFLLYNSAATGTSKTEYAFSLAINNEPQPPEQGKGLETGGMFTIRSVSFSVWNTSRQAVLKKMGMGSISQLLAMIENDDD